LLERVAQGAQAFRKLPEFRQKTDWINGLSAMELFAN
jgi:hypothetical protein